ncbi:MAG: polysaccharide export protein [Candidatus Muirbacterium halophilum]|nr:polysaccharide export protein [Candidatus Muirbacterium halophilum]MCK9475992.1 polysaccharide export protein [Candidatus Muirbacterium halophilum]
MNRKILFFLLITVLFINVFAEKLIIIEKGDLLRISTHEIEEYNFLKYVDENGYVVLPYVGKIKVSGLDTSKVSSIVKNKLEDGYFRNPQVNITVEKSREKKVYIFGLVRNAGEYNYKQGLRVLELVSLSGGYLGNIDGLIVKIFRNNSKVGIFRLSRIISENRVNYNVEIQPDDIVCILSEAENEIQ